MFTFLVLMATAANCPDAAVAEYELNYEAAIPAYEACAKAASAPEDKAPLFLRIGILQLELGNDSAARLVIRAALGYDPTVRPRDNVSPKSLAFFDEVLKQVVEPDPDPSLDPMPEPDPSPVEVEPTPVLAWSALGGGAAAVVVGGALYALYYGAARPPDPAVETSSEFAARASAFDDQRALYETTYWTSLLLVAAGATAMGAGAWLLVAE